MSTPVHLKLASAAAVVSMLFHSMSSIASAQVGAFVGASGVLSTPDALVANTGTLLYQHNNFIEDRFLTDHSTGTNHVFSLGVYSRFEVGGRLTDFKAIGSNVTSRGTEAGKRDLSGNAKFNVYKYENRAWLSVGANDFAGLARNFSSSYLVATGHWNRYWLSAGVAAGDNPSFNGAFVNLRASLGSNFSLVAERDTSGALSAGIEGVLPITPRVSLGAVFSANNSDATDDFRIGINLNFKLDGSTELSSGSGSNTRVASLISDDAEAGEFSRDSQPQTLSELESSLAESGFSSTRIGKIDDDDVVVQWENTAFPHSDQKAINTTLKLTQKILPGDNSLHINLYKYGNVKYTASYKNSGNGYKTIASDAIRDKTPTWYISEFSRNSYLAKFTFQPELRSAIGTEFGTIDYTLGVRSAVDLPLWQGGSLQIAGILPLANSENYDSGEPFSLDRLEAALERAIYKHYWPVSRAVHMQIELGQVRLRNLHYSAVKMQAAWQATHQPLILHASAAQYRLGNSDRKRGVFLGTASYTFPSLNAVLSASYGQYFFGETGVELEATRRFGNTFATAFLKILDTDDLAGGLQFSLPIGPDKSLRWKRLVVAGSSLWSHALQTTISFPDADDNRIQPYLFFKPLEDSEIVPSVLDRGRLNPFDLSQNIGSL